ncbi:MAG: DUF6175 family protein [Saprospiraceae bacterium]
MNIDQLQRMASRAKWALWIGCFILLSQSMVAQESPTAQPTIMVVPYAREGVSLRKAYESSELMRIAITKVKEAFDQRGVNTIDLRAKLKQTNLNEALQDGQQHETKDDVISVSGADIYVEVEATANPSSTGNSANIIMTAFDAFSGESFANKTAASPKFYTDNYEKLVEKAVETEIDNLLNTIQEKFHDIHVNGRTITLHIGVDADSDVALDAEFNDEGDYLSELIEQWVSKNAYQGTYHLQGVTSNKITFDQVKIPLFDENGQNFRVSAFANAIRKYLRSEGVNVKQTIQGNNIVLAITGLRE